MPVGALQKVMLRRALLASRQAWRPLCDTRGKRQTPTESADTVTRATAYGPAFHGAFRTELKLFAGCIRTRN